MSLSDWNVDDYKTDYEAEDHWELRRKFMETYKDKFPEDELVCLAQVFVNVEFMGCRYPDETMRLVGELSQDVASEFRKERAGRLKRTFVKASDAAEQKAKGYRLKNTNEGNTFNITAILKATKIEDNSSSDEDNARPSFYGVKQKIESSHLSDNYWNPLALNQNITDVNYYKKPLEKINLFSGLKFGKFILNKTYDFHCLSVSANKCGVKYEEKEKVTEQGEKVCEILLNGILVSFGKGNSGKIAKRTALDLAMEKLKEECYSIKLKPTSEKIHVSRNNETTKINVQITTENSKIDQNNIGYKMMKKLGWSGGALGVRTKGREDPIDCLTIKNNRKGLGNESEELNSNYFNKLLKSYTKSDDIRDLCFDLNFTKEERARLHQIALAKNLKSASHGKGTERYLVISKKTISPENILTEILIHKNDMYLKKYEVRVPQCKSIYFPEHTHFEDEGG